MEKKNASMVKRAALFIMKKETLGAIGRVLLLIALYLGARYGLSLLNGEIPMGWETFTIAVLIITLIVFSLRYLVTPERSLILAWQFLLFLLSGHLLWSQEEFGAYAVLVALGIYIVFLLMLLPSFIKAIASGFREKKQYISAQLFEVGFSLLIVPAVLLGEKIF